MHCVSKHMRVLEPTTKIWMKIHSYCQRRRCSSMTLVSGNIRFMWIFARFPWTGGVKRQWDNRKRRFSGFRIGRYVFGTLRNVSSHPKIYDLEWPWMAFLRSVFTITNNPLRIHFTHFCRACVELVYITWPAEMCGSGPWSVEYLGYADGLRIFRRRYIVGTLTRPALLIYYLVLLKSLIAFPLTPKHVTLNDLEWPFCIKFCFAPVCLELRNLAFEAWLLLNLYECCRWTLILKEQLRHRAVSLGQHGFLVNFGHTATPVVWALNRHNQLMGLLLGCSYLPIENHYGGRWKITAK